MGPALDYLEPHGMNSTFKFFGKDTSAIAVLKLTGLPHTHAADQAHLPGQNLQGSSAPLAHGMQRRVIPGN